MDNNSYNELADKIDRFDLIDKELTIYPNAVHSGHYRFVPNTLSETKVYVLNDADCVFEILPDCALREVGFLRGFAKGSHGSEVRFHPRDALAAHLTEKGMAVSDLRFETFERFGVCTDTAVYSCDNAEFVFIPGKIVTLGWDSFLLA